MKHRIEITNDKKIDGIAKIKTLIKTAVFETLTAEKINSSCEVSVLLTDDEGIRELNREFRDVDKSTDVLSFPANEMTAGLFEPQNMDLNPQYGTIILGDMAISVEHAVAQGEEFGHGTRHEIQYLTVHSVLHLLGYDHMDEGEEKRQMRDREKEIMSKIV